MHHSISYSLVTCVLAGWLLGAQTPMPSVANPTPVSTLLPSQASTTPEAQKATTGAPNSAPPTPLATSTVTALPSAVPSPLATASSMPTPSPTPMPVASPKAEPTSTPEPTPTPKPLPAKRPWPSSLPFFEGNFSQLKPKGWYESTEIFSPSPGEQFQFVGGPFGVDLQNIHFGRRLLSQSGGLQIYSTTEPEGLSIPPQIPMPWRPESYHVCPGTGEVLFLSKPVDAAGKLIPGGHSRKLFLYQPNSGTLSLIWKRGQEVNGQINPQFHSDSHCKQIFISLDLKDKNTRQTHSSLILAERPPKLVDEWPQKTLLTHSPDGRFPQIQVLGWQVQNQTQAVLTVVSKSAEENSGDRITRITFKSARKNPPYFVHASTEKEVMEMEKEGYKVTDASVDSMTQTLFVATKHLKGGQVYASLFSFTGGTQPIQKFAQFQSGIILSIHAHNSALAGSFIESLSPQSSEQEDRGNGGIFWIPAPAVSSESGKPALTPHLLKRFTTSILADSKSFPTVRWHGGVLLSTVPEVSGWLENSHFSLQGTPDPEKEFPSKMIMWRIEK